jgi:hypothetical protein
LPIGSGFWAPHRVPLAPFIQFPWRLLGPIALLASVVLGIAAAAAWERRGELFRSAVTIGVSSWLLFVYAWPFLSTTAMPTSTVATDSESMRQGMFSATDADEYLPGGAATPPPAPRRDLVLSTRHATAEYTSSNGSHHLLRLHTDQGNALVTLGIHDFPGWRVATQNGPAKALLERNKQGLIQLRLPAAGEYDLHLDYGISPAGIAGSSLSVAGFIGLLLMLLRGSRFWPWRLELPAPRAVPAEPGAAA